MIRIFFFSFMVGMGKRNDDGPVRCEIRYMVLVSQFQSAVVKRMILENLPGMGFLSQKLHYLQIRS
jgi:hypothetical protein